MEVGAFAIQLIAELPGLIKAGIDVYDIITHGDNVIKDAQDAGRDITDAEWQESNDLIAEGQAERDAVTKDVDNGNGV